MIALILHFGSGLSWSAALLFGSIVSATDPVSVLALFKKLGAPKRLTVILEGESLFNDGTAVVVFRIILGVVIGVTGLDSPGAIIANSLIQFAIVIIGVFIGIQVEIAIRRRIAGIEDAVGVVVDIGIDK